MEIPAWLLDNARWERPTEILLPVTEGIGPVWRASENRGGWYARLDVVPSPSDSPLWECDHIHPTQDEAWTCVSAMARQLAEEATR